MLKSFSKEVNTVDYHVQIDNAITLYLRRNSMTQAQMAEQLGMSENTLRWKRQGKNEFTLSELLTVSEMCGLTPDEMLGMRAIAS